MKKATFILLFGIAVAAIAAVNPLTWNATSLELGKVEKGISIPIEFEFTNNSSEPVTILEAKGSCGCTEVSYPKSVISPGESASVKASFKSEKTGVFKKNIKLRTSASADYTYLYFSGEVVEIAESRH